MRLVTMVAIAATLFVACPAIGEAQSRVPAAGSIAVGGETGLFVRDRRFRPKPDRRRLLRVLPDGASESSSERDVSRSRIRPRTERQLASDADRLRRHPCAALVQRAIH